MKKLFLSLALLASVSLSATLPDAGAHAKKFVSGLGHGDVEASTPVVFYLLGQALNGRSVRERAVTVGSLVGGSHLVATRGHEALESVGRGVAAAGVEVVSDYALPHVNALVNKVPGAHHVSEGLREAFVKTFAHVAVQAGISFATTSNDSSAS